MTAEQRKLVYDLVITPPHGLRRISPEDFAQRFPSALDDGKLALGLLEEATQAQNGADLEAAIIVGATFGFTAAHVLPLCQLLRADWHCRHEDIVSTLQRLKDPRAVDALYEASFVSHSYLDYDEFYGLARKCTWALADIGTPDARAKLQSLAAVENALIAEYAQQRIDNWDNEQNRKVA